MSVSSVLFKQKFMDVRFWLGTWAYLSQVSGLDFDTMEAPISNLQDLKDKKFAVFGTGDQEGYPDNFCDATAALVVRRRAVNSKVSQLMAPTACEVLRTMPISPNVKIVIAVRSNSQIGYPGLPRMRQQLSRRHGS